MPAPTNRTRAERAKMALETYRGLDIVDESHIQDIISDLLHLAERTQVGWEFVGRAIRNFAAETKSQKWQDWASKAGEALREFDEE